MSERVGLRAHRLPAHTASPGALHHSGDPRRLRVLSYNIQAGVGSGRYRDYLVHGWRFIVPHARRWQHLDLIASKMRPFDVVGLQETDAGSLRTGFVSPTGYLATHAGFPYWYDQVTRRLGQVALHSNGLLSRHRPLEVQELPLPGPPGRGALVARYALGDETLAVIVVHLALGRRARRRQMGFLAELVNDCNHAVVMGDLNCDAVSAEMRLLCDATSLEPPWLHDGTFPSWRPRRRIDHIIATTEVHIERTFVPRWLHSDHLPVAAELRLPAAVGTPTLKDTA